MIVRHFLQWVRTAEAVERAEATSALARAYLYSDLTRDDRIAAEGAMIMLLDDPSPRVRQALAEVLGFSPDAPGAIVHALVNDQPDIAWIVRDRAQLAGRGAGASHRAGRLREGDRRAGGPFGRRTLAAGRALARVRPAHRRAGAALAAVGQRRVLRAGAGRIGRAAGLARQRA